ncbi:hypothetical protein [Pseudonocardia sp. McavD-2-B]|uniref:hypothetical protein n=1 Tax=Pseudonocardia sp. McavD-2-B TaxID=2954499 RepID=UPI002096D8FA|nr:hypothetical protein [Pseudonocardia sp. McavD-2-B]MCO7196689.1 hypothetical protein [Pseudonocardia sp. McavD-2-B]
MTDSLVAILLPGAGGRPELGGTGTLVTPTAVLVHPPLSRRLRDGEGPTPVRVAVCGWDPAGTEVIDVAGVQVSGRSPAGADEPVVGLVLATPSSRTGTDGFGSEEAVAAHLLTPYDAVTRPAAPAVDPGATVDPGPGGRSGGTGDPSPGRGVPDGRPAGSGDAEEDGTGVGTGPPAGPGDGEGGRRPPPESPSILCSFLGIFVR